MPTPRPSFLRSTRAHQARGPPFHTAAGQRGLAQPQRSLSWPGTPPGRLGRAGRRRIWASSWRPPSPGAGDSGPDAVAACGIANSGRDHPALANRRQRKHCWGRTIVCGRTAPLPASAPNWERNGLGAVGAGTAPALLLIPISKAPAKYRLAACAKQPGPPGGGRCLRPGKLCFCHPLNSWLALAPSPAGQVIATDRSNANPAPC